VEPSRTDKYFVMWTQGLPRPRARGVLRSAVVTTALLAVMAGMAGVLLAFTQQRTGGVGWAWAAWTLVFAYLVGRVLHDVLRGPVR